MMAGQGFLRGGIGALAPVSAALALMGCAAAPVVSDAPDTARTPSEIVSGCCSGTGDYPPWAIELADANVELMRRIGLIQLRRGRLERVPRARALVEAALRPGDVVFVHNRNRVSGQLIPGQFTHGAFYVGTEAQLRAAGLWDLPALAPYRDRIAGGNVYLEAVDGGVRLTTGDVVLNTDAVVALRPQGMERAAALRRGVERMGVPFDMRFDSTDGSELFCAELIGEIYPAAPLPRTPVPLPGRETIMIDAIVAEVLSGKLPFALVGYVRADARGGVAALSAADLARDIRAAWR